MSIKYNGKTIAGGYTPPYATDNIYGITRIATDDELKEGLSKTTCITPYQLSNHGEKVFSNVSLSNLDIEGEKHFINKSQITNCLLEVPQRIKLELNNGTLTLKAGSEVIVPNGFEDDGITPKFDYLTIENDISTNTAIDNYAFMAVTADGTGIWARTVVNSVSGANATTTGGFAYDTSTNKLRWYNSSGVLQSGDYSFPVCIIKPDYSSIEQTFNGMGYIGSTVWVDKGVKGLIPNGRNQDGSLMSIEHITDRLYVYSYNWANRNAVFVIDANSVLNWAAGDCMYFGEKYTNLPNVSAGSYGYVESDNKWYLANSTNNFIWTELDAQITPIFTIKATDNNITSFNPKQPIRLVDSDNIDGQVVYCGEVTIFNTTTIGSYTIDLSSYVPIDGHGYDLYICCAFGPDNSSDRHDRQVIVYDGTNTSTILARFTYNVANSQVEIPTIIPLSASAQSKITVKLHSSNSVPFSRAIIYLHAIRRRGNSI